MYVLEARFHARPAEDNDFVVVGRVVWTEGKKAAEPLVLPSAPLAADPGPDALLTKLRYIVKVAAAGSFDRCRSLRSRFWSFRDVTREVEKEGLHDS
jgi:hypothetical protein